MSWGRAMLPRRPSPVPQPELPESPGAPRPGFSFWTVHKKARPHMAGLSFTFLGTRFRYQLPRNHRARIGLRRRVAKDGTNGAPIGRL